MKRVLGVVASALTVLCLATGPALAQEVTVPDQQGDTESGALDLLAFTARNLDHRVAVEMTFEDTTLNSDIVVSVDPRGGTGVRMVSRFRPAGHSKSYLLDRSFRDKGAAKNTRLRCRGLQLRQGTSDAGPTVTLSIPSRCLAGGDYGALRFAVLIEKTHDADWAPTARDGDIGQTDWVARG
jgi:hypothetical protein